ETKLSPDGQKAVFVNTRNCGATTDWVVEASLLNANESITNYNTGNIMRINSDLGRAWPTAPGGWPIISAQWENPTSLTLHYSRNSVVMYKTERKENISVRFVEITP